MRFLKAIKRLSPVRLAKFIAAVTFDLSFNGFASREEAGRRYSICKRCPALDREARVCLECGCGVNPNARGRSRITEKVYFQGQGCPLKKW